MRKWGYTLVGLCMAMAMLILGSVSVFAASQGSVTDNQCSTSSMEKEDFFLMKCGRGTEHPDGFYLLDHGKQIRFPFTGNTIIESVSPFLALTDPTKREDILIVERDTNNYALVYLTAYKYLNGTFTKIDSISNESSAKESMFLSEFLFGGDGGYTVYLQELSSDRTGLRVATKVYIWNTEMQKFIFSADGSCHTTASDPHRA
ncbi:hypothetical protein ACFSO0_08755 [Brevibacillus sp. GCM10020057]|uniref:hypothetical protein n=1 Tax=Brevibacillus sp. GCM10020057 TaxID=3317327 RepID=UPI00362ADEEC